MAVSKHSRDRKVVGFSNAIERYVSHRSFARFCVLYVVHVLVLVGTCAHASFGRARNEHGETFTSRRKMKPGTGRQKSVCYACVRHVERQERVDLEDTEWCFGSGLKV